MTRRYFTVSEANQMIPELESRFGRMLQLHAQIRAAYDRLEDAGFAPDEEDFEISPEHVARSVLNLVQAPRQRLEQLFLEIVERARDEQVATSGAVHGGETADFLTWSTAR